MTKTQWLIIVALGIGVLFVFCCGVGAVVLITSQRTGSPVVNEISDPFPASSSARPASSALPTLVPLSTATSRPTTAPSPTKPTATVQPTITPPPSFAAQTQKIGPINDSLRSESFTAQVTVSDVKFLTSSGFSKPKAGFIYTLVTLTVQNAGPGSIHSLYSTDFQVKDANGALRNSTYVSSDCDFDLVDLQSGGKVSGCISFELPSTGKLEFVYAPYKYEGLKPGRYLSFVIRQQ